MTLKPTNEVKTYRRNLPHIEMPGSVYFITFRTREGVVLSEVAKDIVLKSLLFHDGKKYKLYSCVVMETHSHVVLQPLTVSAGMPVLPSEFALNRSGETPEPPSGSTGILPVIIPETGVYSLPQIMHSIKSYSAKIIKEITGNEANIWLGENYDRIVRDEPEFVEKLSYICNNPVKAGLVERPENYKWLYLRDLRQDA